MIPDFIKREHAKRDSQKPYPCAYCLNGRPSIIDMDGLQGRAKVVATEFLDSSDSTDTFKDNRCNGGLRKPTHMGDCDNFIPLANEVRVPCQDYILDLFQADYMMYVLTTVWANEGITRKEVVDRRHKGYHTRSKRIDELIEDNFIDEEDGRLYTTYDGQVIAERISDLNRTAIDVFHEGDILDDSMAMEAFEYIKDTPRCSYLEYCIRFGITEDMANDKEYRTTAKEYDVILYQLIERGYIVGEFDSYDWDTVVYTISDRGRRQWQRHQ